MKRKKDIFFKALLAVGMIVMLEAAVSCNAEKDVENTESITEDLISENESEMRAAEFAEIELDTAASQVFETQETEPLELESPETEPLEIRPTETQPVSAELEIQRPKVRGIYVTGPMAGTGNMNNLIDLVDRTELNALVIDIKNDEGRVVCEMNTPTVQEISAVKRYVRDMPALVQKCKEKNIYLIARIVAFKDPYLAEARPDWSLHNTDGTIFRDKSGEAWVNPYEQQVWEYLLEVAEGAVELGFDEVQFDYIRFSTDSGMKQVDFGPFADQKTKTDVITEFTAYASERLHAKGAAVSADVYGVVIDSEVDQQIVGQDYTEMAKYLDYLSPMVYPSHYGPYNYNIPIPDAQPYDTVLAAMQASKKVLAGMEEKPAEEGNVDVSGNDVADNSVSGNDISGNNATAPELTKEEIAALKPLPEVRADARPWLQDFTATWVKGHISYGPQQIREQIQAVYDAGYKEWILWNAANRYTEGGLLGAD